MSLATTYCRAALGIEAPLVTVEVHLANGLPAFNIVGLPEKAVQESRDRVRSALLNAGYEFPARRITVNLAPADLPKEGSRFDLAIAVGILAASDQLDPRLLGNTEFIGELTLSAVVRPVRGLLPAVLAARDAGHRLMLPADGLDEARLVEGAVLLPVPDLLAVAGVLAGECMTAAPGMAAAGEVFPWPDLAEVKGQAAAKRALTIAAAGGHNLIYSGPPGTGKSMLAGRLPGILPPMSEQEAIESALVWSVSGQDLEPTRWRRRPFRAPHHTSSAVALVGGGGQPRPGEISLAHHGVLFLDELPEFDRKVLEVLREPLESGRIHISRAARQAEFPARFQLVAAMNPCPCGHLGDSRKACRCTSEQVQRYRSRLSGPLLDRLDLWVEVPPIPAAELEAQAPGETSERIRERVIAARERQLVRQGEINARLTPGDTERHCRPDAAAHALLGRAIERLGLSARAYHRVMRVARTIADLAGRDAIGQGEVAEAIGYRPPDGG